MCCIKSIPISSIHPLVISWIRTRGDVRQVLEHRIVRVADHDADAEKGECIPRSADTRLQDKRLSNFRNLGSDRRGEGRDATSGSDRQRGPVRLRQFICNDARRLGPTSARVILACLPTPLLGAGLLGCRDVPFERAGGR